MVEIGTNHPGRDRGASAASRGPTPASSRTSARRTSRASAPSRAWRARRARSSRRCPSDGFCVLNADSRLDALRCARARARRVITFSLERRGRPRRARRVVPLRRHDVPARRAARSPRRCSACTTCRTCSPRWPRAAASGSTLDDVLPAVSRLRARPRGASSASSAGAHAHRRQLQREPRVGARQRARARRAARPPPARARARRHARARRRSRAELHHAIGVEAAQQRASTCSCSSASSRARRRPARSRAASPRERVAAPRRHRRRARARAARSSRPATSCSSRAAARIGLERLVESPRRARARSNGARGLMFPGSSTTCCEVQLFGYISFRMAMAALTAFVLALWWGGPAIALAPRAPGRARTSRRPTRPSSTRSTQKIGKQRHADDGRQLPGRGAARLGAPVGAPRQPARRAGDPPDRRASRRSGFVDDFKKLTVPESQGPLAAREDARALGRRRCSRARRASRCYAWSDGPRHAARPLPAVPQGRAHRRSPRSGSLGVVAVRRLRVARRRRHGQRVQHHRRARRARRRLHDHLRARARDLLLRHRPRRTGRAYLGLPHVAAASEMAVVGGALCGACMGFLWYNALPGAGLHGRLGLAAARRAARPGWRSSRSRSSSCR